MSPYYEDALVTLYCGDALEILPTLPRAHAVITDPPYEQTSLAWDRWPTGWPTAAAQVSDQMWCFGSLRMFLDRAAEWSGWRLAQDVVWEKHNGSSPGADRFRRIHELAVHFYRGAWEAIPRFPQYVHDAQARSVHRKARPPQWGGIGAHTYVSEEGGPRLLGSVLRVRSCHGYAVNEAQKPEGIVAPLLYYSVPPGGLVIDCFSGSGTTLAVARKTGRRAIGIEKRESQCQRIVERLAQRELI